MTATLITIAFLIGGGLLLYYGGELLVANAAQIGLRLGLSPLVVGLTIVSFGTSSPELAVSLSAALDGVSDVAVGNVVGSNICNIALILGLSALVQPIRIHMQLLRVDVPLAIVTALACIWVLADDRITRGEGAVLATSLLAYLGVLLWLSRREPSSVTQEFAEETALSHRPMPLLILGVVAGLALLTLGGEWFVDGAIRTAEMLGVSQALIGLTIVAVGTSLPELATSLIAAARGHGDIAIGNIVGSNIFNVLGILGLSALATPLVRGGVLDFDLGYMLIVSLLLWPMAWTGRRLVRLEAGALLAGYVGYLVLRAGM